MAVIFSYADRRLNWRYKKKLKIFIELLMKQEQGRTADLAYIFCSDQFLLKINKEYLNHDYYTDIITFDLSESKNALKGEVYISLDRVRENTVIHKSSFKEEILRVIFHGALHLCGYRDKKKSEIKLMRQMEDHYIRLYNQNKD